MLNWFINEHNASQAPALNKLITCLVYHEPKGWLYVLMGSEFQYSRQHFETRELAQTACEIELNRILRKD